MPPGTKEGPSIVSGIKEAIMPLLTKMLPLRETVEDFQAASILEQQQNSVREEKVQDRSYEDFEEYNDDDECLSSDMEGSIIHRGRPKKKSLKPPAIPARNEKRASKILESVMLELNTLDKASKDTDTRSMVQESDPHESYLSSEEDASLSDDYEDFLFEGSSSPDTTEEISEAFSRPSRRKSQEDTARVVSFISVGKPQIVDIFIPSNHTSPVESLPKRHSMNLNALTALTQSPPAAKTTRRPTPLKLYNSSIRRMSISSISSSYTTSSHTPSNASVTNLAILPVRKSSRLALNINSLVTNTKGAFSTSYIPSSASATTPSHSFLSSDPYPQSATSNQPQNDEPLTPKTPTSMAAAAWKRGLSKTLSKARKPSMPKLSTAYTNSSATNLSATSYTSSPDKSRASRRISTSHSNYSYNNLARMISSNHTLGSETGSRSSVYSTDRPQSAYPAPRDPENGVKRSETMPALPSPSLLPERTQEKGPIRYDDVMKGAIRIPPPVPASTNSPATPSGRRSFSFGVGMGRRKSIKVK